MLKAGLANIKAYSRRVLITKRTLPVFAFLILAMIIVWPQFSQNKEKFALAIPSEEKQNHIEMENLRFFGLNNKKLPMTLNAPTVHQISNESDLARMETPHGTYKMSSGDQLHFEAPYALINQNKEQVLFEDKINIKSDSGYIGHTKKVLCDFNKGTADGDQKISISGPSGKIEAQGIWMEDKGNIILFKKQTSGYIKDKGSMIYIEAQDGLQINQKDQTLTAQKSAKIRQKTDTLKADKIILYYTNEKENRISKMYADGHVTIDNAQQTIFGNTAIYDTTKQLADVTGNVVIQQGAHKMFGDKAIVNLKTGKSELISSKRITGQFMPNKVKGETHEK